MLSNVVDGSTATTAILHEVEHGSGLGGFLEWESEPHYLPYPYPCPTLPYPMNTGAIGRNSHLVHTPGRDLYPIRCNMTDAKI